MYAPIHGCREATIEPGTAAARAMDLANMFRARTPCVRCGGRRMTDRRGDGVECLGCGAWSPPETPSARRPRTAHRSRLRAAPAPDLLAHLAAEVAAPLRSLDGLAAPDLVAVLDRCALAHAQVHLVEQAARDRLHELFPEITLATVPLLTAKEVARRLGVSRDYVRAHGERLGIAVPLDGVVRYHPGAVERVRQRRLRREPPRD